MGRAGFVRISDDVDVLVKADDLASSWGLVDSRGGLGACGMGIEDGGWGGSGGEKVGVDVGEGAMCKRGGASTAGVLRMGTTKGFNVLGFVLGGG